MKKWQDYIKRNTVPFGECWDWTGAKNSDGYARATSSGGNQIRVHRLSYDVFKGPLKAKDVVCHSCDRCICVNPDHLFVGTHADNVRDRVKKNRSAIGARNGRTKLTELQVIEIRQQHAAGVDFNQLGKKYKVDRTAIKSICLRKTWKHL